MKLHFEPNLDYQIDAIEAVCGLFRGQEICRTEFTVTRDPLDPQSRLFEMNDLGIGNRLTLLDDEIVKNLKDIQLHNGLQPSETLASGDFTVEMETGTGKTYVYLRTIFELNKRYGFTKFVIVVPSIAIKEGVYHSIEILKEHFKGLYAGVPFDPFPYDSSKLGQVRNFATSAHIQIMVVTVGAINKKDVNNLYKDSEKTGGEKPIDLVRATRPIIIVDEPQSVDGGLSGAGKKALKDGTLEVPEEFAAQLHQITHVLKKLAGRLEIKNADERRQVRPRQAVLHSAEFKALWDRIKHKTTYRVQFDNERLVRDCAKALRDAPVIPKTRLQWRKADLAIGKAGIEATEREGAATVVLDEADIELPDLLTDLQDRTQLTRRSIYRILIGSARLDDFKRNPQQFIELAAEAINRCKRLAIVDGIKYQRLGGEHYYAQELFEQEELTGYLKNLIDAKKAVYEQVVYDSDTEAVFADQLEKNTAIKVYAKLPGWFTVPTPLGGYNPDWAVLVEQEGEERLYFVVETKGTMLFADALRPTEQAKIDCGRAHFKALEVRESPARYIVATSAGDLLAQT